MQRFGQYIYRACAGLTLTLALGSVGWAQQTGSTGDFTFRHVPVPTPGTSGNRITVQIAPSGPAAPSAPANAGDATPEPATARPDPYAWFWAEVSPDMDQARPGRLQQGVAALRQGSVPQPSLATLQQIASNHGQDILRETIGKDVSPAFVLAVIAVESAGQADAVSGAGAQGLMQLIPATAERFGVEDSLDPAQNIAGGVAYLSWLMNEFDKDPMLVLAAYNAGEGAVRNNNGVPPYRETRAYVPKVLAAWTMARALCVTPPELISDGCVFSVN